MKAITFQGIEQLTFSDVDDPVVIHPSDVIVRVQAAGLCGSDLHPYFGRERGLDRGTVMGHELIGEIAELGGAVQGFRLGQRVVAPFSTNCGECRECARGLTSRCARGELFGWVEGGEGLHGAQAEYVRVPMADSTLVRVPEELEDAAALLACDILPTAEFGLDMAQVRRGESVVVVGCGPVGLLAVRAAVRRGARVAAAIDIEPGRAELAVSLGAERGLAPQASSFIAREGGVDAVVEAAGTADAVRLAASLLRPGGHLAAVAVHTEPHLSMSPAEMYDRNITFSTGRCPARHYLPDSLAVARREAESLLAAIVSHRLPLSDGIEAYRAFGERRDGWHKVVLLP